FVHYQIPLVIPLTLLLMLLYFFINRYYPLGYFSAGNDAYFADLSHEVAPKIVAGVAGSVNKGASHQTGEGHGIFQLFNADQREQYPDYRKIYADLLFKYQGF